MLIEKLDTSFDTNLLWFDCLNIISKYGWGEGQLCLTHRPELIDDTDKIFDGAGSLLKRNLYERDFSVLNEVLQGTYLEEIFKSLPYDIGRFRLMRILPRTCYSIHVDSTKRIHIPLITNKQAFMIFPYQSKIEHLPADGSAYLTDTTVSHTAMNGGLQDRYHLVGALKEC